MTAHASRAALASAALAACLLLGGVATAAAACPAVGATTYIGNTCATPSNPNAPCYRRVVNWKQHFYDASGRYTGSLYTYSLYANGYYQWVYQGTSDVIGCQK